MNVDLSKDGTNHPDTLIPSLDPKSFAEIQKKEELLYEGPRCEERGLASFWLYAFINRVVSIFVLW